MTARRLWLALGVVGALVLFAFELTITLALGVAMLVGFVGAGWWLIAAPGFLDADDD